MRVAVKSQFRQGKANCRTWLSNRIGYDSIRFSIKKLQKPFNLIRFRFNNDSIQYQFVSKKIRYKTASAFMKENWPSGKRSIFKVSVRYKGINVSKSPLRFCFVNFSSFLSRFHVFLVQVFVKIELNRIENKKKSFDLIWIQFDSI